jgi:hypothetical protein
MKPSRSIFAVILSSVQVSSVRIEPLEPENAKSRSFRHSVRRSFKLPETISAMRFQPEILDCPMPQKKEEGEKGRECGLLSS